MYDTLEVGARVQGLRRRFLWSMGAIAALFVALFVLIFLHISDTVTVLCIIGEGVLLLFGYIIVGRSEPKIIFGKEIIGQNIKEEEYIASLPVGSSLGYRQVGSRGVPQPFAPNTRANRRRTPPNVRGEIYLRLDDGNIALIRGLGKAHMELYEDGDRLQRLAGTRYPIIVGRSVTKQPCPICGEINDITSEACHTCGLGIKTQAISEEI